MKKPLGFVIAIFLYFTSIATQVDAEDDGIEDIDFTYRNPGDWYKKYPKCGGNHQSPIDISPRNVVNKTYPVPLKISGINIVPKSMKLINNGHHVIIEYEFEDEKVQYTGGPLGTNTYALSETIFHWGKEGEDGGEVKMSGKSGPLDMQFLFYNTKYGSVHEALDKSDGLVGASRLVDIDDSAKKKEDQSEGLKKIGSKLSEVRNIGSEINIDPFPIAQLVSTKDIQKQKFGYVTYNGSLSVPPCYESVIWLLNVQGILTTSKIVEEFRKTKLKGGDRSNVRPPQPINNRKIEMIIANE